MTSTNLVVAAEAYLDKVSKSPGRAKHMKRAAFWVKHLRPEGSELVQVAAMLHDIERDVIGVEDYPGSPLDDPGYLSAHQHASAIVAREFLIKHGAKKAEVDRVYDLIRVHEVGGDEDQNLLMDADSISFLENNIQSIIKNFGDNQLTRDKIEWMYDRIASAEAKSIADPMYTQALIQLKPNE